MTLSTRKYLELSKLQQGPVGLILKKIYGDGPMISTSWDFSFRGDGFETKTQKYSHKISKRRISG